MYQYNCHILAYTPRPSTTSDCVFCHGCLGVGQKYSKSARCRARTINGPFPHPRWCAVYLRIYLVGYEEVHLLLPCCLLSPSITEPCPLHLSSLPFTPLGLILGTRNRAAEFELSHTSTNGYQAPGLRQAGRSPGQQGDRSHRPPSPLKTARLEGKTRSPPQGS